MAAKMSPFLIIEYTGVLEEISLEMLIDQRRVD